MEFLIYTTEGCLHHVMDKHWFYWEPDLVYLLFQKKLNHFEKLYGTRSLRHVRIAVDVVTFEKPWNDMTFIRISGIPNLDKSLHFFLRNCFCKQITFVVLYPYNQDKVNYQLINKL